MNKITVKKGDCFHCPDDAENGGKCKFLSSECPMPMPEITMREMVEWLKIEKLVYINDAQLRGDHSEIYERDIAMYDAILAALSGPGEEERRELLELMEGDIEDLKYIVGYPYEDKDAHLKLERRLYLKEKILAIIQGDPAPGKEEKE